MDKDELHSFYHEVAGQFQYGTADGCLQVGSFSPADDSLMVSIKHINVLPFEKDWFADFTKN
jgi:hypothetical protein